MKELQKKSMKHVKAYLILFLVCAIFFGVLLVLFLSESVDKTAWEDVDFTSNLNGVYVDNFVPDLYGQYCEKTEDGKVTGTYYFMSAGETHVMGIGFDSSLTEEAKQYMNALVQYDKGDLSQAELEKYQLKVQGSIVSIPEDELKYYKDAVDWDNLTEEEQETFLFYKVNATTQEDQQLVFWLFFVFVAFPVLCILIIFIRIKSGFDQRDVKKYLKSQGNFLAAVEEVERFFQTAEIDDNIWLDDHFIAGFYNTKTIFAPLTEVAWVYEIILQHYGGNGLIEGLIYSTINSKMPSSGLKISLTNGKQYDLQLQYGDVIPQVLEKLEKDCPWIETEYTEELEKEYKKDRARFLNGKYNRYITKAERH